MKMKAETIVGGVVLGLIAVGLVILSASSPSKRDIKNNATGTPYVEIVNPSGFVNTEGITIGELIGKKVILVDFLTYSCINCQRTFPYLNAWHKEYEDEGLSIIGIHTPEFAFEKNIENVRSAMKQFNIVYPIVLDNDYATWRAWGNRYWPRKYLIDIYGNVVYDHIGEGAYEETEMKIRELLAERALVLGESRGTVSEELVVASIPTKNNTAKSPETYFGSARNEYLVNGMQSKNGEQVFMVPGSLNPNALYLGGTWNITPEYAESVITSTVFYKYNAKTVHIIAEADMPTTLEVWKDGTLQKTISVEKSMLYTLIEDDTAGEHTLELRIKDDSIRLYAFTFG